jgi:hypothetical protein
LLVVSVCGAVELKGLIPGHGWPGISDSPKGLLDEGSLSRGEAAR